MVNSVDEVDDRDQLQVRISRISKLLDARIACALNKIIQSSHFMKKVSVEKQTQEAGRFLRGGQIDYTIDHNFRVSGARDTILDYADVFSTTLRNDNVEDFDTRWDEIPWSMTKIPSDDVLENLSKMRIRESDQFKTLLQLYDMENSSEGDDTQLSEDFDYEISTPETSKLREEKEFAVSGEMQFPT